MSILDEILGTIFTGCLVTGIFYGLTCLQTIQYFIHCKTDGRAMKFLVFTVALLDTTHMALVSHFGYIVLVKRFANPSLLGKNPWHVHAYVFSSASLTGTRLYSRSLPASILVNLINDTIIRTFFARRAWLLSGQCILTAVFLGSSIVAAFVFTLWADIETMEISLNEVSYQQPDKWMTFSSFSLTAIADLLIAASLCIYLFKSRNQTYERTNGIICTLCKFAINTGLIATLWSVGCLVSYALKPKTELTFVFYLPLSKIYINAFLASLNVRESLRERSRVVDYLPSYETRFKSISFATPSATAHPASVRSMNSSRRDYYDDKFIPIRSESPRVTFPINREVMRGSVA